MADYYLKEDASGYYQLEDGSGVFIIEGTGEDVLLADDLATGTPTLTSAVIGQIHALAANDVATGTPTLTSAALGQVHVLAANDIDAGTPTLTSAALGQAHVLLADEISAGTPTLTSPMLETCIEIVDAQQASNWQPQHRRIWKRPTKEELAEIVRAQRIALGILPPDLPGQAIGEPADIATEVAQAVHNETVMAEIPIDYASIYRAAYLETEHAIAEYRGMKRKRRSAAAFLLLH